MKVITTIVSVLFSLETISCQLVNLPFGTIKGKISQTAQNTSYYSFEKVPYASPPTGPLRFKAPILPDPWDGIRDCTENKAICYQVNANYDTETEDCLYLNIYTPELPSENSLPSDFPVMVYIHGGGFIQGTCLTPVCGPDYFLDRGVIIVTVNYRLGPFGFLSTEDNIIPGNNGLKDQFLALKWVHSNIRFFSGDPEQITIFGQSAGSASVAYQLLNTKSQGLYRAAILQSGSFLCPWAYQRRARQIAFHTASFINNTFVSNNSKELLNFLIGVSAEELDAASYKVYIEENAENYQLNQGFFYAPVIEAESDTAVLTKKMYGKFKSGDFVQVPVLIGIASEEALDVAVEDFDKMVQLFVDYDRNPEFLLAHDLGIDDFSTKQTTAQFIKDMYGGRKFAHDIGSGVRYSSDNSFTRPIIKHAEIQSKLTDTYFYQFSYDGLLGNVNITIPGTDKVAHSEDFRYLWRITLKGYDNSDLNKYPRNDVVTHNRLLTMWTNFAKYLNPTPQSEHLLENVLWPKVSDSNFYYMDIDEHLTIRKNPKNRTYVGWNIVYDLFGSGNYDTF